MTTYSLVPHSRNFIDTVKPITKTLLNPDLIKIYHMEIRVREF